MQSPIDSFLFQHVPEFTKALDAFDRHVDPESEPHSDSLLDELTRCIDDSLRVCRELEGQLNGEDPVVLKELQARYRDALMPWLGKSWIMARSVTKPRGYPGDYGLLTAIYNGVPKTLGFGGYVDRYLLNFTLGRAVPARMWSARRFLMEEIARRRGRIAVLNVACGPCREYAGGFQPPADSQITFTCVDNDPEALEYAKSQSAAVLANSGITSNFVRYNALRMTSAKANIRRFGRNDIIYSVGLCDYIPDEYLIPLLKGWRESLHDGGVVYVAFKDARLYDKTEYHWLLDWYFFQRVEEDFQRLFAEAGYDQSRIEVSRDATGVILNYLCRCQAADVVRVDVAEQMPLSQHVDPVTQPTSSEVAQ